MADKIHGTLLHFTAETTMFSQFPHRKGSYGKMSSCTFSEEVAGLYFLNNCSLYLFVISVWCSKLLPFWLYKVTTSWYNWHRLWCKTMCMKASTPENQNIAQNSDLVITGWRACHNIYYIGMSFNKWLTKTIFLGLIISTFTCKHVFLIPF